MLTIGVQNACCSSPHPPQAVVALRARTGLRVAYERWRLRADVHAREEQLRRRKIQLRVTGDQARVRARALDARAEAMGKQTLLFSAFVAFTKWKEKWKRGGADRELAGLRADRAAVAGQLAGTCYFEFCVAPRRRGSGPPKCGRASVWCGG